MLSISQSYRLIVSIAALLATLAGNCVAVTAEASRESENIPPSFIFILVDDLGWTDLGCTGSDLYETPNIDRLGAAGVRFTYAYSACTDSCEATQA